MTIKLLSERVAAILFPRHSETGTQWRRDVLEETPPPHPHTLPFSADASNKVNDHKGLPNVLSVYLLILHVFVEGVNTSALASKRLRRNFRGCLFEVGTLETGGRARLGPSSAPIGVCRVLAGPLS